MGNSATPATHATVHELAIALTLDEPAYHRAVELAQLRPRPDWLHYLDRFLAAVGALLIAAGIAAFFAWNWADLHHFAKFALIEAGIVAAVLLAWRLSIDSTGGRASLFVAAFLIGVLLAVFGQVYQTGADPYGLFLAWALMILPFALVGRQPGLWLLFQLLLNLTLIMYWTQVLHPPSGWWQLSQLLGPLVWIGTTTLDSRLASWLFALNAAALVTWEFAAARGVPWLQGRTGPRIVGTLAFLTVLGPTGVLSVVASAGESTNLTILSPVLFAAALAACLWCYQYRKADLLMLTVGLFRLILVIMALAIRHLTFDGAGVLLVFALLLVAQVAGAAYWLKGVSRRWQAAA
ncbi:MAG: DUF2157 domain-containing protein [Woeseia sp.]